MVVFKSHIISSVFIIVLSVLYTQVLHAKDLVDLNWLSQNKEKTIIIDLRSPEKYQTGHIKNAINIHHGEFSRSKNNIDGFVITPAAFKAVLERYGIKNSDTVVLYSDWSFLDSMRVYWVMDFYGHKNIKVLDGGIQSWLSAGGELSLEQPIIKPSQYTVEINSDIITTKFRTFMASKNEDYVIVDARNPLQYQGVESLTQRKGHIPGAINVPWINLLKGRSESNMFQHIDNPSTFQDINILKEKLSIIPKDKKIILYCNGGKESSVLYFALKRLGRDASLYDGSWFEWSADSNMPITTNDVL